MKLETSALLNHDRSYKFQTFPAYLNDAFFIQVPHRHINIGSVITITTSSATTLYFAFEYPGLSGGFDQSLPNAGWTKEEGEIINTLYGNRTNNLNQIYSMTVNGPTSISLPATTTRETVCLILGKCSSTG